MINSAKDLVWQIAARAKELADMPMPLLRRMAGDGDNNHQINQSVLGMSRGKMIEAVLSDEFEDHGVRLDMQEYNEDARE